MVGRKGGQVSEESRMAVEGMGRVHLGFFVPAIDGSVRYHVAPTACTSTRNEFFQLWIGAFSRPLNNVF